MRKIPILFMSIITGLLCGCKTEHCDVTCGDVLYTYAIVGFTDTELHTTVITHYNAGSGFSGTPLDSSTETDKCTHAGGDTSLLSFAQGQWGDGWDEELSIPADNTTYKVTNITVENYKVSDVCHQGSPQGQVSCAGKPYISSYIINGQKVTFAPDANPRYIYIVK